ncbi:hypothetical protein SMA60_27215, partial [Escherichia coli]|uniref:hypothetical protein n=1 Tax=Escherichia coli TaxID=562 RepID=UPI00307B01CA
MKDIEEHSSARFDLQILSDQPPTAVPADNLLVEVISRHTQSILGICPQPHGLSGATVTKQLIQKGIVAVGFGPGDEAE